jgi:DNA replication protein DnaC
MQADGGSVGGVTSYTFTNIAEAILQGHSTTFITAFDLTSKIQKSLNPAAKIDYYSRVKVLCIDELGYT